MEAFPPVCARHREARLLHGRGELRPGVRDVSVPPESLGNAEPTGSPRPNQAAQSHRGPWELFPCRALSPDALGMLSGSTGRAAPWRAIVAADASVAPRRRRARSPACCPCQDHAILSVQPSTAGSDRESSSMIGGLAWAD